MCTIEYVVAQLPQRIKSTFLLHGRNLPLEGRSFFKKKSRWFWPLRQAYLRLPKLHFSADLRAMCDTKSRPYSIKIYEIKANGNPVVLLFYQMYIFYNLYIVYLNKYYFLPFHQVRLYWFFPVHLGRLHEVFEWWRQCNRGCPLLMMLTLMTFWMRCSAMTNPTGQEEDK